MARAFLVYGPRGAGKTTTTVRLAERIAALGHPVGGFFQRTVTDELGRRGYDLVRLTDRSQTVALARPGTIDQPGTSAVCSFSFRHEAFDTGLGWLRQDARAAKVLLIDEVSKLEVRGEGHAAAVRWCLGLDASTVVLLSVRGDQLFYVVEAFSLDGRIAGYMEIPAESQAVEREAEQIAATLT